MTDEYPYTESGFLLSPETKSELQKLGFVLSVTPDSGVMWGFDGATKYFPRETYIREEKDGKPKIKLRLEKTNAGLILIINSIPFKEPNHLSRSELDEKDILPIVNEYLRLI